MSTPNEYMFNNLSTVPDFYAWDGGINLAYRILVGKKRENGNFKDYEIFPQIVKQLPFETPIGNMVAKAYHDKTIYAGSYHGSWVADPGTHYFIGSPTQAVWDKVDLSQLFALRENYVTRNPQTPVTHLPNQAPPNILPDNVKELFNKYKTQLAVAAMLLLIILIIKL